MARIATVDDYPLYAQMVADLIARERGHEVKIVLGPIMIEEITNFAPDVIVVSLVRKLESMGHAPLQDFYQEVEGARSLREIAQAPETKDRPIILASMGVREVEIPTELPYIAFVQIPQEMEQLLLAIDKLVLASETGQRPLEA